MYSYILYYTLYRIEKEKAYFGVVGSDFDFAKEDIGMYMYVLYEYYVYMSVCVVYMSIMYNINVCAYECFYVKRIVCIYIYI